VNNQVHRHNVGVIPHLAFEKVLYSGRERGDAVWELAKKTCLFRFFCVTLR